MKNSPAKKPSGSNNGIAYGDIFAVGDHLVACGDARDPKFIARALTGRTIDQILVDVPYGANCGETKDGFANIKVKKKILNDDITTDDEYAEFTTAWLEAALPHLTKKNNIYIFNSDLMLFALRRGMEDASIHFSQLLIWIKSSSVIGRKDYLLAHELIVHGWFGAHAFRKAKDKSVIYYPKQSRNPLHPTQKPVGLLRRLILNSTKIGDTVYDCFAGSGSTGIAAEQTKRRSILIERDEEYVKTILDRFQKLFGFAAERIHHHETR